jgi:hypothetical protein
LCLIVVPLPPGENPFAVKIKIIIIIINNVQNGSETHPVSYPMGTGGSFPGDKAARDVTLAKNGGTISPLPHISPRIDAYLEAKRKFYLCLRLLYMCKSRGAAGINLSLNCVQVNGIRCN